MGARAYFEIPDDQVLESKDERGSAPGLLANLLSELRGAREIQVSFFLYNNMHLHRALVDMAAQGCKVTVYTIPLNGYDRRSVSVSAAASSSKWEKAKEIYDWAARGIRNFEYRVFPHTYIWYKQRYSRGREPYSLHNKSIMAWFPDGRAKCISTSCNFAFGDPRHSENLLVVEDDPPR